MALHMMERHHLAMMVDRFEAGNASHTSKLFGYLSRSNEQS